MPYEFRPDEPELEPQASGGRAGIPPRKFTSIGVLDSPVPPKRLPGPIPAIPASLALRILGGLLLVGVVAGILFLLFGPH